MEIRSDEESPNNPVNITLDILRDLLVYSILFLIKLNHFYFANFFSAFVASAALQSVGNHA